ncbi:YceK/YidQ family lipoprotein [Pseudomonas sp. RL_105y_Pfl2_101]|uniref:YceK/YidQ family lipoprotein n=1 Tax=Pseudomonas sp. RL_105y_Pfl2_101 TaxID=3088708 RepID=UPI0030D80ED5
MSKVLPFVIAWCFKRAKRITLVIYMRMRDLILKKIKMNRKCFMVGRLLRAIVMSLAFICMSGCGTFLARVEDGWFSRNDSEYYKGVDADVKMLGGNDSAGYLTMICYMTIVCPFLFVASIPADLVVDTLLLPYDHMHATRQRRMTYRESLSVKSYGYLKFDFDLSEEKTKKNDLARYSVWYKNRQHSLVLNVDGAPLVNSISTMAVPYIEGYESKSMHVYLKSDSGYQGVNIYFGNAGVGVKKAGDAIVNPQPSGEILTCDRHGNSKSTVSITPYLSSGLYIFLGSDRYGSALLRC